MKSMFHLFTQDDTYGPGTDLAIALLGIFILSMAISMKTETSYSNRLNKIAENQKKIINAVAKKYNSIAEYSTLNGDSVYLIALDAEGKNKITIKNYEVSQLFSFGNNLLFEIGQSELKEEGKKIIASVGETIKNNLECINEIQIQGHADTTPINLLTDKYKSNIELASARATTVFNFLNEKCFIDPSLNLMSITSYGEFKPAERKNSRTDWNRKKLNEANDTEDKRRRNRRIEIVLFYK
ncbi:MAG: OmpA family protein [Ferruginibacter sp.]